MEWSITVPLIVSLLTTVNGMKDDQIIKPAKEAAKAQADLAFAPPTPVGQIYEANTGMRPGQDIYGNPTFSTAVTPINPMQPPPMGQQVNFSGLTPGFGTGMQPNGMPMYHNNMQQLNTSHMLNGFYFPQGQSHGSLVPPLPNQMLPTIPGNQFGTTMPPQFGATIPQQFGTTVPQQIGNTFPMYQNVNPTSYTSSTYTPGLQGYNGTPGVIQPAPLYPNQTNVTYGNSPYVQQQPRFL